MRYYRKLTRNADERRLSVYNVGCNFACKGCSYKLLSPPASRPIAPKHIEELISQLRPRKVTFLGGEPTTNPNLERLLRFTRERVGAQTWLGHTNGNRLPLPHLDGANVSLKAYSPEKHLAYTGYPSQPIYENLRGCLGRRRPVESLDGLHPRVCRPGPDRPNGRFVASLDPNIPFHPMGYVPVPGTPWPRPTAAQMQAAVAVVGEYLANVTYVHLTEDEMPDWQKRSRKRASIQVA